MDIAQVLVLALIQGFTEFLPISSSAHLILPGRILGWDDQGLAFDAAVHLGSLTAVFLYFRTDLGSLTRSVWAHVRGGQSTTDSRFAYCLLIASLPIIPVGFISRYFVEAELRNTLVIALTTIGFGFALLIADYIQSTSKRNLEDSELGLKSALLIGMAQCLALIPGTSRSGITITTALLAGHSRQSAARISFLISIPAIAGAAYQRRS